MKALDHLYTGTEEGSLIKLEYPVFFGGGDTPEPWWVELLEVVRRLDLTLIHAWRSDLFRRFVSIVSGRRSGVTNRPFGSDATLATFEADLGHAIMNIGRIIAQTRALKQAYGDRAA